MREVKLRNYQAECLEKINEMEAGNKKIAFIATGGGKTVIMAEVAKNTEGRVLIVVDQSELRQQTLDKISRVIDDINIVGSVQGKFDDVDKKIVIATRQSLTHGKSTRLERMLEHGEFSVVMVDECHRAVSQVEKIIYKVANEKSGSNFPKIIGFTATPWNPELRKVFDGFVYEKDVLSLIDEGYLCQPRCYRIPTTTNLNGVKTVGGEFAQGELSNAVNTPERNALVVKVFIDYAKDRKHCIVFATSIEHAEDLTSCFLLNGIDAKSIDSTLDVHERELVLNKFKNGEFKVLINVGILTTGFDFEALDTIIMARPTKSKILYTQCIGRGLRIAEDKEDCLMLDLVDNIDKNNLLNSKSIFEANEGETLIEAKDRKKNEEEKLRLEEEIKIMEQKKIEEEQERLRLEEINLFNANLSNISSISSLDWFFTEVYKKDVAILSINGESDIFVFKTNGIFVAYKYTKLADYKYILEEIQEDKNLKELIEEIDSMVISKGSSFINKRARWKYEEATEKQKLACKFKVKTKWESHKFFSRRNCYFAVKELIK